MQVSRGGWLAWFAKLVGGGSFLVVRPLLIGVAAGPVWRWSREVWGPGSLSTGFARAVAVLFAGMARFSREGGDFLAVVVSK
ncbi:hypothetical protein EBP26_08020 [Stutzerimonas stutzeri ATCC 17588 = LMG 11199]|nr:hypothetical protein EBP26_08020 [Stutzerimonas stutzeri ATCC 17588 = LMG 11199]